MLICRMGTWREVTFGFLCASAASRVALSTHAGPHASLSASIASLAAGFV